MSNPVLDFVSATDLAAHIRAGDFTATEVAEYFLQRVTTLDPGLNSIVWRDDDSYRAAARNTDERIRRGEALPPFAGVPITIKDLFNVAGQPNPKGSNAVSESPVEQSDLLIDLIFDAGFLQLGRSASPELAMTTSAESTKWGITRNPWNPDYSPGGSSGGSAAAVAAGLVPAAAGSDGGGSIRVPAAFCGVIGLKPSRGLLPQRVDGWEGGAVEGVITRTIADTAAIYQELARPDPYAWAPQLHARVNYVRDLGQETPNLKIGLLTTAYDPRIQVDGQCSAAAEDVARTLERLGHEIVPIEPIPAMAEVMNLYAREIIPAWLQLTELQDPSALQPYLQRHLENGRGISAERYLRAATSFKLRAREITQALFGAVDVVLSPTAATLVPRIGVVLDELNENAPLGVSPVYEQTLAFTTVPSVIGSPAISLPTHEDSNGLPLGTQFVGRPFAEPQLLQLGRDLERSYRWNERRPPAF